MKICRVFNATEDAAEAAADLRQATFGRLGIQTVSKTAEAVSAESIEVQGIIQSDAEGLAEQVNHGGTLLIVDAPFGTAATVVEILRRARAHDSGRPQVVASSGPAATAATLRSQAATPLSTALDMPVLLSDPAPLSKYFKWPTLTRTATTSRSPLFNKPAPLSSLFRLPILSNNAAPFSSLLRQPPLSAEPAPFSKRMGRKVLWDNPTPLSSLLKLATLTPDKPAQQHRTALLDNPAPFSSALHIPVLSEDKSDSP